MSEIDLTAFGYAPGDYHCSCLVCKENFHGDKRATVCKSCAENTAWKPQPNTPSPCNELERYTALELVRSIDAGREPEPDDEGDYCSYDEAIEIIAAKDARIAELEGKLENVYNK